MENIELKTGDLLFSKSNYHGLQKIEVERLTNTQIVLEGYDTKLRKPFSEIEDLVIELSKGQTGFIHDKMEGIRIALKWYQSQLNAKP